VNYKIQSVARAFALLESVAESEVPVTARALADAHGISLPTTYHLLNTLVDERYLRKERRSYTLTTKIAELAEAFERLWRPAVALQAAMRSVAQISGETAYVSTWSHGDVTIVAVAEGTRAVRVAGVMVGLRGSAHARASGKVLLSFGPPSRVAKYLQSPLERLTPHTISDRDALLSALAVVRDAGYALDMEEFTVGVCCLAVPVFEDGYAVSALTVSVPVERFVDTREELVDLLTRAILADSGPTPVIAPASEPRSARIS
jgi:DNA-binding IclR family transcriptional regulator